MHCSSFFLSISTGD